LNSDFGEGFRRSTLHFIDFLKGRTAEFALTGADGRRVVELYHALARAAQQGRAVEVGT